jgi:hypothetical protein
MGEYLHLETGGRRVNCRLERGFKGSCGGRFALQVLRSICQTETQ